MDAPTTVENAILASGIPPGASAVVAVSGGPDSVALLDAMHRATSKRDWTLTVAHVNHGLREEGRTDERFVRALARDLGLAFRVRRVDTGSYARENHLSIEAAARALRYAALRDIMRRVGADLVVTGHTLDDQAETVLLHLLRGAGLGGLGGMRSPRDGIYRPLLGVRRVEILAYLQQQKLGYRLDASNLDSRHQRNRIRLEVAPVLERLQPGAIENLARAAWLLQADADFIGAEAQRALLAADFRQRGSERRASRPVLRALHPALQRAAVRTLLAHGDHVVDITAAHIEEILALVNSSEPAPRGSLRMTHGRIALVESGDLVIRLTPLPLAERLPELQLAIPGAVRTPVGRLTAREVRGSADELHRQAVVAGPFHVLCEAERLGEALRVRSRRAGDRIRPLGLGGSRKLQDLFVDRKVPVQVRDRIPVVLAGDEIVWVPGFALSERFAAADFERPVIELAFRPTPDYQGDTIQRHF